MLKSISDLKTKLFADGADLVGMVEMASMSHIKGMTTNPTLMRKAQIGNYKEFAFEVLRAIPDKPISFEVFSDDFSGMIKQALEIASWGPNVYVKIPVTTTTGKSTGEIISFLAGQEVKVNVTAIMTSSQVRDIAEVLKPDVPAYVSVFAGRIADTGRDPIPTMVDSLSLLHDLPLAELIWASPRELLNVFQADEIGCHIITATNDILKKLTLVGHDLDRYSLETVQMFRNDALAAGYQV